VRQLIARHISTVKELEVLVKLAEESRPWTAQQVGESLYFSSDAALRILVSLSDAGLATVHEGDPPMFEYNRFSGQDAVVRELADLYRQMRVRIIEQIYSGPEDAIQNFADSFIIKKDKDKDKE
jgi:predicted transcriptional regulator